MDEEVREFFRTPATRSRTTFAIGHGGGTGRRIYTLDTDIE